MAFAAILSAQNASKPLSGSFGFLLNAAVAPTSADTGSAALGLLNFDGAGNVAGTYNVQIGNSPDKSASGNLTGTYSTNPDGTGTATLALDAGITLTFAAVVTDGGNGLQLAATACSGNCDLGGIVISGVARAAYTGVFNNGSYGFQLTNSPAPAQTVGVASFDGAGNMTVSETFVSFPSGPNHDPNHAPMMTGTASGTYTRNPDGSGSFVLATGKNGQMWAFVTVDGGAGILLMQLNRSGDGVAYGTARQQS